MKTLRAQVVVVSLSLLGVAVAVSPQAAQATLIKNYAYSGNKFTTATGPFIGSELFGFMAIDCESAGGAGDCTSLTLADYSSSVTAFLLAADDLFLTDESAGLSFATFAFSTDTGGAIVEWALTAGTATTAFFSCHSIVPSQRCTPEGDFVGGPSGSGRNSGPPGSWFSSESVVVSVPEPPTVPLLLVGLVALVLFLGRRRALSAWSRGRPLAQRLDPKPAPLAQPTQPLA